MNKTSTNKIIEPKLTEMKDESDDSKEFPYEPGENVISNILNYSKALSIRKTKNGEFFEMVLN